jgi:hypothetical protein
MKKARRRKTKTKLPPVRERIVALWAAVRLLQNQSYAAKRSIERLAETIAQNRAEAIYKIEQNRVAAIIAANENGLNIRKLSDAIDGIYVAIGRNKITVVPHKAREP